MIKISVPLSLLFVLVSTLGFGQSPVTIKKTETRHGPENGSLILVGGGGLAEAIWATFSRLAGGTENGKIVVITAAAGDSLALSTAPVEMVRRETGIQKVTLLHTKDIVEANSEAFIAPLLEATGVFFVGGRQWRIADSYLSTRTHHALNDVLARGGVIAGTSAGATIQGSFLWRGDTRGPDILVGDHTQGLGFLKNSVIDQHLLKRNRQFDLIDFIKLAPEYIGIGLDEATAVVIQRDALEVIGKSYVAIYDYESILNVRKKEEASLGFEIGSVEHPFLLLSAGQKYDLKSRKLISK